MLSAYGHTMAVMNRELASDILSYTSSHTEDPKYKTYYAVKRGHKVGIYPDWNACQIQTSGYKGAAYAILHTFDQARLYLLSDLQPSVLSWNKAPLATDKTYNLYVTSKLIPNDDRSVSSFHMSNDLSCDNKKSCMHYVTKSKGSPQYADLISLILAVRSAYDLLVTSVLACDDDHPVMRDCWLVVNTTSKYILNSIDMWHISWKFNQGRAVDNRKISFIDTWTVYFHLKDMCLSHGINIHVKLLAPSQAKNHYVMKRLRMRCSAKVDVVKTTKFRKPSNKKVIESTVIKYF